MPFEAVAELARPAVAPLPNWRDRRSRRCRIGATAGRAVAESARPPVAALWE
jgi:hypothetical protein